MAIWRYFPSLNFNFAQSFAKIAWHREIEAAFVFHSPRSMARPVSNRVNLSSIAERLGVSVSTVSRALRQTGGIHPETEARIAGLAHEMGYSPKGLVRSEVRSAQPELRHVLALSQTTLPHIDQRFMAGMSGAAVAFNVAILSHLVAHDQCLSVLDARLGPASLRGGSVRGVVLLHRWPMEVAMQICGRFPTVSIVHDYPGSSIDLIGIDDRRGVDVLVEHLYQGGHRRLGFFGLCPEVSWSSSRFAAFVEALTRRDMVYEPRNAVRIDLESALSPSEFAPAKWSEQVLARLGAGVDAWLCASTMTAQSLFRFFLQAGVRVPQDAALVSYHGGSLPRVADLPFITTTDVVDEELGAAAIRRLINRLDKPSESRRSILVPANLVVGDTTRAPAGVR
jgi:DNA-binding LacI/PurR family transcriptional regulator